MFDMNRTEVDAEVAGKSVRITVVGEIDMSNASELQTKLDSLIDNDTEVVELDLTDVGYLDSSGLRILYTLTDRLRIAQIDLRIIAPRRSPARLALEVAGMASICPLDPP